MGVSSAIINFNNGSSGMLYVLKDCNIEIGFYTQLFFGESDQQKQEGKNRKSSGKKQKQRRNRLRVINKGHIDTVLKANQAIPKEHFNFVGRCITMGLF